MTFKKFKNGNFSLRYEKDYDKDDYGKEFTNEAPKECNRLARLVVLICNSAEMDFMVEDDFGRYAKMLTLYNANTQKFYNVSFQDALDFFKGKTIRLVAFWEDSLKNNFLESGMFGYTLECNCSCCGKKGTYEMNTEEYETLQKYWCYGREMGKIQDLFPKVPTWIRSGAIDQYSNGFCICPECSQ